MDELSTSNVASVIEETKANLSKNLGPSESTENPPPYIEQYQDNIERRVKWRRPKRKGALVFCVACGAINRTLRKWHNSYLCTDCFKIAQNVGDEKFIAALQGKEI
jgi:hypothetical protein